MSTQLGVADIEYPESDGKPMGETDVHRGWMNRVVDLLQFRYRRQRVYVTGNLLVYYEQGHPKRYVVPDAIVVKECEPGPRRVYKIWEEGQAPNVAFEITSRGTKREDTVWKQRLYESLGVAEYFLYDPTGDYLKPPLRGYRLIDERYDPIQPTADDWLECEQLGVEMRVNGGALVMRDIETGEELQTSIEASDAAREAAEARARTLEAEIERLRAQLKSSPDNPQG
ncbi:MAG: Uma2 family endonuclease [Planctomycetaceae bacterium]|nr:Uma2 family endonuclease [Planctomycetaceae bacterium]